LHHGLRGREADRDAKFVKALGKTLGIPVTSRRIAVLPFAKDSKRSLEDAGRFLRYRSLLREARKREFNGIATGHQMDDQAETLLLNLLRGSQAKGLAGIPPSRVAAKGVLIIRPLLGISRKEVLEYLRHHGLSYHIDKSNQSLKFTRNWIRNSVMPILEQKNPSIRENLALVAEDMQSRYSGGA
jgi:tRNA(Ile)-lysidine synthase